jgi:hypothetical protein
MTNEPIETDFNTDAEFATAHAEWTLAQKLSSPVQKKKLSRYAVPAIASHSGSVTRVTDLQPMKKDPSKVACSVFIDTLDGEKLRFTVSEKQLKQNALCFELGREIFITAEERVENKTGYFDESGKETAHSSTGLGLVNVTLTAEQASRIAKAGESITKKANELEVEDASYARRLKMLDNAMSNTDPAKWAHLASMR